MGCLRSSPVHSHRESVYWLTCSIRSLAVQLTPSLLVRYQKGRRRAGRPYQLPQTFAGWVAPAWSTSQDEIIRVAGYDAAMYIKALSFGQRFPQHNMVQPPAPWLS